MKIRILPLAALLASTTFFFYSCDKENAGSDTTDSAATTDITVAASATTPTTDSVTFDHQCGRGGTRDSIAESALPAAVEQYLDTAYQDYTFYKAFSETDSSGAITAYIVVIYYDDKPIGLKFDTDGEFEEVLRQRHKGRHGR